MPTNRVLLYSHDTFGLGHLRRSSAIARRLVEHNPALAVLIVTGSPVVGRFTFPEGVDHIRLPGVTKLPDGNYTAESLNLGIDDVTEIRSSLLLSAAKSFRPDMVIVDKEPTGFRGEMLPTLDYLRASGSTRLVLGLRDVLDDPDVLLQEWIRKDALQAMEDFYDAIWIYGPEAVYNPLQGLPLSPKTAAKVSYTGYLRRPNGTRASSPIAEPYILVTPGGGGDGSALIDWVISAYEADPTLAPRAFIVFGPFLDKTAKVAFDERITRLAPRVEAIDFHTRMEELQHHATGVVAMGGYNTFCEILSADKPAIIAPRKRPRMEQYIRATAAQKLGLVRMLDPDEDGHNPAVMAEAIRGLPHQPPPGAAQLPGLLDGMDRIVTLFTALSHGETPCPVA
jgi:predicted glycosyltransferase